MSQHNTVCVERLASTQYINLVSLSILLFSFWHTWISSALFMWFRCPVVSNHIQKILSTYAWDVSGNSRSWANVANLQHCFCCH